MLERERLPDEECDKVDQIWTGRAFQETHLDGTRLRARHHLVAAVESRFIYLHFFLNLFCQLARRLKIGLEASIGPKNVKILLLPKYIQF